MSSNPSLVEKKLLHYTGKAIADFNMIQRGDRVMVCLSGGKDSFTLLTILNQLRIRSGNKFEIFAFTLDQAQPGWNDAYLRQWLTEKSIPHEILTRDTYSIVKEKIPEGKTYCSLCSRLRRGIIYRYAEENGFNKIALGHHRDDLIRTLMMSILYNGDIRSMPPKLLSDNKKHIVIRPMCYVQEKDIITFASEQAFPIIPCNLCGSQENLMRKKVASLIDQLAIENPKVPSNMLHALQSLKPSQLMDQNLWNFKNLEDGLEAALPIQCEEVFNAQEFELENEKV
ncbi:tRNA 2-thiocytidine(32) synthetase TtcA [Legionella pneumophila]|uniref:tRNA 2-thiocytidine(32) synthetase TtcA n=1 Tax=Legionella pneumophila TaxID=446 RepID=UPI0007776960|nr:tRNA 2-thiocytidine(32) synthetase TtcA [Legionella pneumophila]MCW8427663.1 tRNA 2-thiocytidine(32) synthetase TtcA [Legionella pneumophila]HAT6810924.1 tRNA 2-thiocytidine(32) synthetase TtcA [Legionella pneumophila]HAT8671276.1 tRNA 2-thiocytidine(32) synthetase TtcA [Legionella pneumophila]HAU1296481.1 tRNA 2-thiocytidine(32) synthetase TtcA [Legionella pneumophila]HAU1605477.1 tRNA 2-thiocytidine(32) synthetase TtcA [Legionella pneumophila]